MGFKDLHLKLKTFWLRRLVAGDVGRRKKKSENGKRPSWMMPISHGYYVVEDQPSRSDGSNESELDSVVVQREQIEEIELWFFGVLDARIGNEVIKYMQLHLFDDKPKESDIRRKSKETMKNAYLGARVKIRETEKAEETWKVGSASAIVINGDKLVIANMGDYRAVHATRAVQQALSPPRAQNSLLDAKGIDSDTEFVILASTGIWEVMKQQEAVNLIRHIEDPREAAECLAKEALIRMSRSNISCLVIRLD
ncbi:hypothetical protein F0562_035348 [Nyssa sinensis]|uniref:PPM-type phosphatase domain-containing protein n=1 Tax=Nyssa sinensis TaxID=561372 RepID=A0A5J5A9Z1_9ASTE|nr:hypothetical protein F0562_035348 [Nyssa sinensis]